MLKFFLCLSFISLHSALLAQAPNFNFEQRDANGKPAGWNQFGNDYTFRLDSVVRHSGNYALNIAHKENTGFCASGWRIPATFRGKSITLTGFVKTQDTGSDPNSHAGLWMRLDDADSKSLAFDNMQSRGIKGNTDWQSYSITLPLSDNTAAIVVGGILIGKGAAWFDDLTLTVDDKPFEKAPPKIIKLTKAQTDTAFAKGSGITLTTLTSQQIDNLTTLGKVWGFVKYHHPAVAEGNHNMDAELFRVMPTVISAKSVSERSNALLQWLTTFGTVKPNMGKPDTSSLFQKTDMAWLTDTKQISQPLQAQLIAIRQAKRPDKSYYVSLNKQVGNPEFQHENSYRQMVTPDVGYRLLGLYRFWNVIQYFFPYRHLIGENWNNVLAESVPKFVAANDSLAYRLAALQLIGRVHDTHANIWGDPIIKKDYRGLYQSPVQVKYIENQFVVTGFYNDSLGALSGLRRGDVVKSVDGTPTAALIRQRSPYYPASNEPTQLRDISRALLMGHANTVRLDIDRDGKPMTVVLNRFKTGQAKYNDAMDRSSYPKDSCYQLLHPDIGYLFLGNIKGDKLPQIMHSFKDTKGLVIDLRCYPSDFVVFSLGKYLTTSTPFVKFTGTSLQNPGQFTWIESLNVGERNVRDAYKGKVIILVNEITQSSAEYHTLAFRKAPGAIVLGSTTAAADGNISPFELPGGLYTMISGIGVNYPDGRETQRVGVGVDLEMRPTRKGIQEGRDELLEKAIALIRDHK